MFLSARPEQDCMKFGEILGEDRSRSRKITEQGVSARKILARLLFEYCDGCRGMAAIPQGAFAARKVRQNLERGNFLISKMEGKDGGKNESKGGTYNSKPPQTGRELTPLKYNSKLMNSIWGLYNRYSVHNFKKNTDAGDGVFSAAWELIFRDVSPALSSASVVATAAANPLRSKINM